jgi:hypothetical protein
MFLKYRMLINIAKKCNCAKNIPTNPFLPPVFPGKK